jgi:[ribosomal protein S18]-alanine N-acetyltransferase
VSLLRGDPEHAAVLEALHALSFPTPWRAAEFATLLSQPGVAAWIAYGREEPEGFILVRAAADEAEILTLAVTPAYRRKGLASKLLQEASVNLRAGKTARLFLEVAADNTAALALYGRHGFAVCGQRPDYYRGGPGKAPVDAIMMTRLL